MPMTRFFADEFASAHNTLKKGGYKSSYDATIAKLVKFSAPAGPHVAHASVLPKLHSYLITDGNFGVFANGKMVGVQKGTLAASGDYDANQAGDYSRCNAATNAKLAALVLFRHTTVEGERGAQKVMVCSLPNSYSDWPSVLFMGKNIGQILGYLADTKEKFRREEKVAMANAVQHAGAWCQRALIVLANAAGERKPLLDRDVRELVQSKASRVQATASARDLVKRWFADENTTEKDVDVAIGKLQAGFKRMVAVFNSNQLILTDQPQLRNAMPANKKDYKNLKSESFVKQSREQLNVVYIQESFFTNQIVMRGSRDYVRILIHELSHREAGNVDIFYAYDGIKPSVVRLPFVDAIKNADSWAFFAVDAAGQLSQIERDFAQRS